MKPVVPRMTRAMKTLERSVSFMTGSPDRWRFRGSGGSRGWRNGDSQASPSLRLDELGRGVDDPRHRLLAEELQHGLDAELLVVGGAGQPELGLHLEVHQA